MGVATRAVHVTVRKLFFGCHANFGDFHIKVQSFAGEWVIPVNRHHIALNAGDDDRAWAGFRAGGELHACAHFALKRAAWNLLD